ncbi:hypothetical protein D3C73_1392600 [compost metagenome]
MSLEITFKNKGHILLQNPFPRIGNGQFELILLPVNGNSDGTARSRVLQGIGDEIGQELLHSDRIYADQYIRNLCRSGKVHTCPADVRPHGLKNAFKNFSAVALDRVHRDLTQIP